MASNVNNSSAYQCNDSILGEGRPSDLSSSSQAKCNKSKRKREYAKKKVSTKLTAGNASSDVSINRSEEFQQSSTQNQNCNEAKDSELHSSKSSRKESNRVTRHIDARGNTPKKDPSKLLPTHPCPAGVSAATFSGNRCDQRNASYRRNNCNRGYSRGNLRNHEYTNNSRSYDEQPSSSGYCNDDNPTFYLQTDNNLLPNSTSNYRVNPQANFNNRRNKYRVDNGNEFRKNNFQQTHPSQFPNHPNFPRPPQPYMHNGERGPSVGDMDSNRGYGRGSERVKCRVTSWGRARGTGSGNQRYGRGRGCGYREHISRPGTEEESQDNEGGKLTLNNRTRDRLQYISGLREGEFNTTNIIRHIVPEGLDLSTQRGYSHYLVL